MWRATQASKEVTMSFEKVEYKGWKNCYRIANDNIELVITSDIGPRIMRLAIPGGTNELFENESLAGKTGGEKWASYGGHRFWHAPEDIVRTYAPDNRPVTVEDLNGKVRFIQSVEPTTGIQKEIDIVLDPKEARATIIHRMWNRNLWAVELAPWALSVMAGGGEAILPLPPRCSHDENMLPVNTMSMWGYTDMSDSRYTWGRRFILVRHDGSKQTAQKFGLYAPDGWIAYARDNRLFVKIVACQEGANYPDMGCNLETYTDSNMLEVETLGPLVTLAPGQKVEHWEQWLLFKGVPMPKNDEEVERNVMPLVTSALRKP
jgi:hypothetical protein